MIRPTPTDIRASLRRLSALVDDGSGQGMIARAAEGEFHPYGHTHAASTRDAEQLSELDGAVEARRQVAAAYAQARKIPPTTGQTGHSRGYAAGRLLSDDGAGAELACLVSAAREAKAKRVAAQWRNQAKGRRLLGSQRDRRNPLKGRQATRASTWDRVCAYNAEIGVGRSAPATPAGFKAWLEAKAARIAKAADAEAAAEVQAEAQAAELLKRMASLTRKCRELIHA